MDRLNSVAPGERPVLYTTLVAFPFRRLRLAVVPDFHLIRGLAGREIEAHAFAGSPLSAVVYAYIPADGHIIYGIRVFWGDMAHPIFELDIYGLFPLSFGQHPVVVVAVVPPD